MTYSVARSVRNASVFFPILPNDYIIVLEKKKNVWRATNAVIDRNNAHHHDAMENESRCTAYAFDSTAFPPELTGMREG